MIKRYLLPFVALILVFSIGGVHATWKYAEISTNEVSNEISVKLDVFDFRPDDILPGGNDQPAEIGQNHNALIELILNEKEKGYGLNNNKKPVLMQYLENDGSVHCHQKVGGGNLKFILDVSNNTHGLYYVVEMITDDMLYAYTFSTDELSTASGSVNEIRVYRTTLEKQDKWIATVSYEGYAFTKSMSDLGLNADPNSIKYSIDIGSWHL